jgi:hypothetical protein
LVAAIAVCSALQTWQWKVFRSVPDRSVSVMISHIDVSLAAPSFTAQNRTQIFPIAFLALAESRRISSPKEHFTGDWPAYLWASYQLKKGLLHAKQSKA